MYKAVLHYITKFIFSMFKLLCNGTKIYRIDTIQIILLLNQYLKNSWKIAKVGERKNNWGIFKGT